MGGVAEALMEGFQSTLPARGATLDEPEIECAVFISIHAPRTGSDGFCHTCGVGCAISIHAPRTGSDRYNAEYNKSLIISIHAPRTGSDSAK